jgi:hypothetical protein
LMPPNAGQVHHFLFAEVRQSMIGGGLWLRNLSPRS